MAHLLLVDDEESLRSVVAERLTDHGFDVVQAADGESALKALDGFAFDVIVSDLRLPGVDGRWIRVEAAPLDGDRDGDIAVTIRTAGPGETFALVCRAHGLTRRETAVVAALTQGLGTREVARTLHISDWTVQDHLKSVFVKLGVHSRRQVLARLAGN